MTLNKSREVKLHVISDMHNEFRQYAYSNRPEADIVIAAGDIGSGTGGLKWLLKTWPDTPVVYVPGNHEFYNERYYPTVSRLSANSRDTHVHVLMREATVISGVRILGAILWTDFAIDGDPADAMFHAADFMNDYRYIETQPGQPLTPQDVLSFHQDDLSSLKRMLAEPFEGPTVVVTHHAPSPKSIHPRFLGDSANPLFVSNLETLIMEYQPALWIHGHMHDSSDYSIGATRVVANPRGYPLDKSRNENSAFKEDCIIRLTVPTSSDFNGDGL